jgi:hypothetical protein
MLEMAIVFRNKKQLDSQVFKIFAEGEPISNSENLSIADVYEQYKGRRSSFNQFGDASESSGDVAHVAPVAIKANQS